MKVLQFIQLISCIAVSTVMICVSDSWRQKLLSEVAATDYLSPPMLTSAETSLMYEERSSPPLIQTWCWVQELLDWDVVRTWTHKQRGQGRQIQVYIHSVIWQLRVYPSFHEWRSNTELEAWNWMVPNYNTWKGFYNIQSQVLIDMRLLPYKMTWTPGLQLYK